MQNVTVKVRYGGEFRKWELGHHGSATYENLVQDIGHQFDIGSTASLHLKYKDHDGDYIILSNSEDLRLALKNEGNLIISASEDGADLPQTVSEIRSALSELVANASILLESLDSLSLAAVKKASAPSEAISSPTKTDNVATIDPSVLEEVQLKQNEAVRETKPAYDNIQPPPPLKNISLDEGLDHHSSAASDKQYSPERKYAPHDSLSNGYDPNVNKPPTLNNFNQPPANINNFNQPPTSVFNPQAPPSIHSLPPTSIQQPPSQFAPPTSIPQQQFVPPPTSHQQQGQFPLQPTSQQQQPWQATPPTQNYQAPPSVHSLPPTSVPQPPQNQFAPPPTPQQHQQQFPPPPVSQQQQQPWQATPPTLGGYQQQPQQHQQPPPSLPPTQFPPTSQYGMQQNPFAMRAPPANH